MKGIPAKRALALALLAGCVPLVLAGVVLLAGRVNVLLLALLIAALALGALLLSFERRRSSAGLLAVIAVMTALSVAGRMIFAPVPFFKPVTAVVIITALYFGAEAGFLTGALSALVSNFYVGGQGQWTPFQMAAWGFIGLLAGLLSNALLRSRILLYVYGALSGVLFSLIMDVLTVLWMDGAFNPARYLFYLTAAAPMTLVYMASNVAFLFILGGPVGRILSRIRLKYGIG